jgi:hypothetical protein
MGSVSLGREFLAAGCAIAVVLLTAGEAGARMLPHKACPLDTMKVETAMETATELSALERRVDDAFQQLRIPLFALDVLEPGATSRAQAVSRLFNSPQEPWVMFETVLEPVFLGSEADQHACRLAMTRDDDLLRLCFSKKARQIILDLGQGDFLHSGFPNCASHKSASDLRTIARTSTVVPDTS